LPVEPQREWHYAQEGDLAAEQEEPVAELRVEKRLEPDSEWNL
jgi:hypothetical protein